MWYQIDERNILRAVSEAWAGFAKANGGDTLTRKDVLNVPLWSFVNGQETRSYLNGLFFGVRQQNRIVSLPYRCDSPEVKRRYVMDIVPHGFGTLRLVHSLLETAPHRAQRRCDDRAVVCAQCLRRAKGAEWVETGTVPDPWPADQVFATCPDCRQQALRALVAGPERNQHRA